MKNKLLLSFLLCSSILFSQDDSTKTETVVIRKEKEYMIYKGTVRETENWFIVSDKTNKYYLINVHISESEVENWFKRFGNSQNIYSGIIQNAAYPILTFSKENEPDEELKFYYNGLNNNILSLTMVSTGVVYQFQFVHKFIN